MRAIEHARQARMARIAAAALAVAAVLGGSSEARGDETCGGDAKAWAAACSASGGEGKVEALRCPADHVIFAVTGAGEAPVLVDAVKGASGMRVSHGIGLSPMGDFDDFRKAPKAVHEGLARIAACVERDPAVPFSSFVGGSGGPAHRPGIPATWRLVNALAFGLLVAALELLRRRRVRRRVVVAH